MIVILIIGIVFCIVLGLNSIDNIGREPHHDSHKGSFYEISNRRDR